MQCSINVVVDDCYKCATIVNKFRYIQTQKKVFSDKKKIKNQSMFNMKMTKQ